MNNPSLDPADLTAPIFGHASWSVRLDESAAIGDYKNGAAEQEVVMAVIEDLRLRRGIFPEQLLGKRIIEITPKDKIARQPSVQSWSLPLGLADCQNTKV